MQCACLALLQVLKEIDSQLPMDLRFPGSCSPTFALAPPFGVDQYTGSTQQYAGSPVRPGPNTFPTSTGQGSGQGRGGRGVVFSDSHSTTTVRVEGVSGSAGYGSLPASNESPSNAPSSPHAAYGGPQAAYSSPTGAQSTPTPAYGGHGNAPGSPPATYSGPAGSGSPSGSPLAIQGGSATAGIGSPAAAFGSPIQLQGAVSSFPMAPPEVGQVT